MNIFYIAQYHNSLQFVIMKIRGTKRHDKISKAKRRRICTYTRQTDNDMTLKINLGQLWFGSVSIWISFDFGSVSIWVRFDLGQFSFGKPSIWASFDWASFDLSQFLLWVYFAFGSVLIGFPMSKRAVVSNRTCKLSWAHCSLVISASAILLGVHQWNIPVESYLISTPSWLNSWSSRDFVKSWVNCFVHAFPPLGGAVVVWLFDLLSV